MNSRFGNLPLRLALGFVGVLVVLLWIVPLLFKAWKLHDLGTSSRPIEVRSRLKSRLLGLAFMLAGFGLAYWAWHDARRGGFFSIKLAFCGPAFVGFGLPILIEAPELPIQKASRFGWISLSLGLVCGFLYLDFLKHGRISFLP